MKVNIHTYSFGNNMPVYKGYIEMDNFDADTCWNLCNWSAWTDKSKR